MQFRQHSIHNAIEQAHAEEAEEEVIKRPDQPFELFDDVYSCPDNMSLELKLVIEYNSNEAFGIFVPIPTLLAKYELPVATVKEFCNDNNDVPIPILFVAIAVFMLL